MPIPHVISCHIMDGLRIRGSTPQEDLRRPWATARHAMRAKHGDVYWGCMPGMYTEIQRWNHDFLFMQCKDFQLFAHLPLDLLGLYIYHEAVKSGSVMGK